MPEEILFQIVHEYDTREGGKGKVITNNYFTPAAVELANANNIELTDRNGKS